MDEHKKLTLDDLKQASKKLGCELEMIQAVAEQESSGDGFLDNGQVKILYEPYIFGRLTKKYYDKKWNGYPLSLSGKWDTKLAKYGAISIQHNKLDEAMKLDRSCAIQSCSYGKFQILGMNYKMAGFNDVESFYSAMQVSEREHLNAFINFVINRKLDDELRRKDFAGFAFGFNGAGYKRNTQTIKDDYDYLIEQSYLKFVKYNKENNIKL